MLGQPFGECFDRAQVGLNGLGRSPFVPRLSGVPIHLIGRNIRCRFESDMVGNPSNELPGVYDVLVRSVCRSQFAFVVRQVDYDRPLRFLASLCDGASRQPFNALNRGKCRKVMDRPLRSSRAPLGSTVQSVGLVTGEVIPSCRVVNEVKR